MNPRVVAYLSLAVAAAAIACKNDPTADLAGKPATIVASPNPLVLAVGDSGTISALVLDETATPLESNITAESSAQAVATVVRANVPLDPTGTVHVFQVKGAAVGEAYVRLTAAGRKDSAQVIVE